MKVGPEDYVQVAAIVVGGAMGSAYLSMFALDPALTNWNQAAKEVLLEQKFFTDAPHKAATALFMFMITTLVAGEATKNYSQVDKLWSIMPVVYAWIYALDTPKSARLSLMTLLVSVWGARLTLNFYRRGGYSWPPWYGEEDYRWKHVQEFFGAKKNPVFWTGFHVGFIVIYQCLLLFYICFPFQFVWYLEEKQGLSSELGLLDAVVSAVILACIGLETHTDQVQYEFQEEKYALLNQGVDRKDLPMPYRQGFLSTGVFAMTRHMNYFGEQSIWYALNVFIFATKKTDTVLTESMIGAFLLSVLFQGSIWIQEQTTVDRWPLYKQYKEQVPQLFPYGNGFTPSKGK